MLAGGTQPDVSEPNAPDLWLSQHRARGLLCHTLSTQHMSEKHFRNS